MNREYKSHERGLPSKPFTEEELMQEADRFSLQPMVDWCNAMTERGICFLCGRKFKGKNKCKCGTKNTCKKSIKP